LTVSVGIGITHPKITQQVQVSKHEENIGGAVASVQYRNQGHLSQTLKSPGHALLEKQTDI
jgi:hypothetical protein